MSFHHISGVITTGCDVIGASGESFSALLCEKSPLLACECEREGWGETRGGKRQMQTKGRGDAETL